MTKIIICSELTVTRKEKLRLSSNISMLAPVPAQPLSHLSSVAWWCWLSLLLSLFLPLRMSSKLVLLLSPMMSETSHCSRLLSPMAGHRLNS